jgi:hypothetical protein
MQKRLRRRRLRSVFRSCAILQPCHARMLCAMGAAEHRAIFLDTVADHLAPAVRASRRQRVDSTLE